MKLKLGVLFIATFILKANFLSAQSKEIKFLIDTCITIMKQNAVNREEVNWDTLQKTAYTKAAGLNDAYQLGPVMRYLYQSIRDFHGAFYYKDSTFQWKQKESTISDSIMNEWKKGVHIQTAIFGKNVGYLRVPSMSFSGQEDVNKKAQSLNDSLCALLRKNIKGIIIDLRLDGGGAMYPMILGVAQLLIPGQVGAFEAQPVGQKWYLKDNNFLLDTMVVTSIVPTCTINAQRIPMVVLIGPGTGSSGEFFLMTLKTRQNTILMGSKTAGYITAVAGFQINDAAYVHLATGYGIDRNGKVYKEALSPDVFLDSPDKFNNLKEDEKIKAATKWLQLHTK